MRGEFGGDEKEGRRKGDEGMSVLQISNEGKSKGAKSGVEMSEKLEEITAM